MQYEDLAKTDTLLGQRLRAEARNTPTEDPMSHTTPDMTDTQCMRCGTEVDFGTVYCPACVQASNAAQDARSDVPCMRCGRPIRKNRIYCSDCVADIAINARLQRMKV